MESIIVPGKPVHMVIEKDGKKRFKCGQWRWRGSLFNYTEDPEKVSCSKCKGETRRPDPVKIEGEWIGKFFRHTYGYDMTINEYAKVIAQSERSITLQPCSSKILDDNGRGSGRSFPGPVQVGAKPFFLRRTRSRYGYESWSGGKGSWSECDPAKGDYYNSWD